MSALTDWMQIHLVRLYFVIVYHSWVSHANGITPLSYAAAETPIRR